MDFDFSNKVKDLQAQLNQFMVDNVYPNDKAYHEEVRKNREEKNNPWLPTKVVENLKIKAKKDGLWNLWQPVAHGGTLTNLEYAPLCEIMGRLQWASEVFNCSAPDTGNMETLLRYGTTQQQDEWLAPILAGEKRSAFLMTEPQVASSDATNIECSIEKSGSEYVINGEKWWSSGAGDPRCNIFIVMGKTDPQASRHTQQSMVLVPAATEGVKVERALSVFGYDDAPHGHMQVTLKNVKVPVKNLLLGEGRGFEIAQGRLGPGRIHHCMRIIGQAERAFELMCSRLKKRVAFGKPVSEQSIWHERIAESRIMIEQARLLTLKAAHMMDTVGNKVAKAEIAMIKVLAPNMAQIIMDWAIQSYGGGGLSQDSPLAGMFSHNRILRLADGPDEVHRRTIARLELSKQNFENDFDVFDNKIFLKD